MRLPTLSEINQALSFSSPGPDGGLRAKILTPGWEFAITAIPTEKGTVRVDITGKRARGAKGSRGHAAFYDEVEEYMRDAKTGKFAMGTTTTNNPSSVKWTDNLDNESEIN